MASKTAAKLAAWYVQNHRALPWRETVNPYHIWVSETMLQQTRVETVIPYYHAFLQRYPTVTQLAQAPEDDVLKLWQGLGYYSRARNLHQAAKEVVSRFGGVIPKDAQQFQSLKGVGPYTAGAVQSIAYEKPVPAVDGNVLRVMARFLAITKDIRSTAAIRQVTETVKLWLELESPRTLTQALMELGALVCKPRNPECSQCPLRDECQAFVRGLASQLPVREKPAPKRQMDVIALWCRSQEKILLEKRPERGLLAGMWQLPAAEIERTVDNRAKTDEQAEIDNQAEAVKSRNFGEIGEEERQRIGRRILERLITPDIENAFLVAEQGTLDFQVVAKMEHVFTHVQWHVIVLQPVGWDFARISETSTCLWADEDMLAKMAIPRVYDKLLTSRFLSGNPLQGRLF